MRGTREQSKARRARSAVRSQVPPQASIPPYQRATDSSNVASALNCGMSIRRRHNPASATSSDASNRQGQDTKPVQPIDESEQDKIVKNLRANTIKMTNELCNVVVLACMGAGALTVIFPLLIAYADHSDGPNEHNNYQPSPPGLSHLLYTITSCLSHCLMAHIAHVSKFPLRWNPSYPVRASHSGLYVSAVASMLFLLCVGYLNWGSETSSSVDPVTIGQMIGNLCTLIAALFVAMDSTSTEDVLRKHDGSRCGFKSL